MVPVFRCSDYLQAQLLAGLLRQHGIDTYLQGAYLQGGVGELPAIGQLVIMVDVRGAARLPRQGDEASRIEAARCMHAAGR
jgi:hypothetical protein